MNNFLYSNFTQLFLVKYNIFYNLFIAFKALVIDIIKKISYNIFIKIIITIEII